MAGQSHGAEVDDGLDVGHIHSGKDHKHEAAENREVLFDLQPIYDATKICVCVCVCELLLFVWGFP